MTHPSKDQEESFRDSISTVNTEGKRVWLYPKMPKGPFYLKRKWVGAFLISALFLGPFVSWNGKQLFLFNLIERKFHFFGVSFWPQDFHLVVLMMLIMVIFVIVFTVAYGRLFCGWVCPQTVFLELLFRPIEYWIEGDRGAQMRLDKQPWNFTKIKKRLLKWSIYYGISFLIANVFLAYLIGSTQLIQYIFNPKAHLSTLVSLIIFTSVFYFVFAWFREQVCLIACPYGRLQGVLLDQHSVVVAYDYVRGEKTTGRAKFNKKENRAVSGKGDCIDCDQCVLVCPTGIDIRNGTQLECVNCTACIDACDHMMEAISLPKGLIRYASEDEISKNLSFRFTPRLKAYSMVLVILIGVMLSLILTRTDIEASFFRMPGQLFQLKNDSIIQNVYTYKLINKSNSDLEEVRLELLSHQGKIYSANHQNLHLKAEEIQDGTIFIELNKREWKGKKLKLKIGLFKEDQLIEATTTHFLGPRLYY
jgi:cytochrome c oxidase accessory protein FixG